MWSPDLWIESIDILGGLPEGPPPLGTYPFSSLLHERHDLPSEPWESGVAEIERRRLLQVTALHGQFVKAPSSGQTVLGMARGSAPRVTVASAE